MFRVNLSVPSSRVKKSEGLSVTAYRICVSGWNSVRVSLLKRLLGYVAERWLSRYSDWLRAGRSGDRIPVVAIFSAPIQTGPGAYPASCTIGTGSFRGVKRLERDADHPPPSKCRGHERVGLYLYSPSGPQWPVIGWSLCSWRVRWNVDSQCSELATGWMDGGSIPGRISFFSSPQIRDCLWGPRNFLSNGWRG